MLKALGMLPVNSTYKTNLTNARTDEARARKLYRMRYGKSLGYW